MPEIGSRKPTLRKDQVAEWTGGRSTGPNERVPATRLVSDSRVVEPGDAFVAVRGGHGFIDDALARGASFVLTDKPVPSEVDAVVVDDAVAALLPLARKARAHRDYSVVAVTGSTGKTVTKDFISVALATRLRVHSAPSSFNNEIGVPVVVLSARPDTEVVVAELGARRPREIAELAGVVQPEVGVLTGVGTAHLEIFGSREAIARTKAELLAALPPRGLGLVSSTDDYLALFSAVTDARIVGVGPGSAVSFGAERVDVDGRTYGWIRIGRDVVPVALPVPARALMRNAAMAVRVAVEYGVPARTAAEAIESCSLSSWRLEIRSAGGWTVVNDSYNANPTSMASALRSVRELAGQRPAWAVLGEMAELGPAAGREHRRMGRLAASLGYAGLVAVGANAESLADGVSGGTGDPDGMAVRRVGSIAEALEAVHDLVPQGAVVLVKGSRVAGLERFVDQLDGRTRPAHTADRS